MPNAERRTILIDPEGRVRFVWTDDLADLAAQGDARISRASHVEPDASGRWTADMAPVSPGTTLGPFRLRGEALAAETAWLEAWLAGPHV